jgi:hypothetical protein
MSGPLQRKPVMTQVMTHLSGGVRADLSDPNVLKVFPTATDTPELLPLPGPYDLLNVVHSLGLVLVGTEERIAIHGLEHRVWHPDPYCKLYHPPDLALAPPELWGALAYAAEKGGDAESSRVMRHVSFTLTAMGRRLMDVSDAYGMQLLAALADSGELDRQFSNTQVFDLFLNCHAFLSEACAARDYLARFLALHVYGGVEADSVAQLLRRKKRAHSIDAILNPANDRANPESWMVRMNEYRDIITHRAPLTYLGGKNTMIEIRFQSWAEGKTLPRILAMIPADPFNAGSGAAVDALILLHAYNAYLLHFAAECARYSPYPPALPQFNSSNIFSLHQQG